MRAQFLSAHNWLFGGAHFLIIVIAAQAESALVWALACVAMSAVSFVAWIANYRRYRLIADVPLSQVASAAQGYAELIGRAEALPASRLVSPYRALPVLWCRYRMEKKDSDGDWTHHESGELGDAFNLRDASGVCTVDVDLAEVHCGHRDQWVQDRYRYTEERIVAGDRVYALGEFRTHATEEGLSVSDEMGALLAQWKENRPALLERFDSNRDGEIDLKEWEAARAAARREVETRQTARPEAPGLHFMQKPADGRLFLVSNRVPDSLAATFRRWSIAHVVVFLGAAGLAVALFSGQL